MRAWLAGFEEGMRKAEGAGNPIVIRAIVTAMRQFARSVEIAELSVRYRDQDAGGFAGRLGVDNIVTGRDAVCPR